MPTMHSSKPEADRWGNLIYRRAAQNFAVDGYGGKTPSCRCSTWSNWASSTESAVFLSTVACTEPLDEDAMYAADKAQRKPRAKLR